MKTTSLRNAATAWLHTVQNINEIERRELADNCHPSDEWNGAVLSFDFKELEMFLTDLLAPEPPGLVISLEGGLISAIVSNDPSFFDGIEITVIDYDDVPDDEAQWIEQGDGTRAKAYIGHWSVDQAGLPVPLLVFDDETSS